MLSMNGKTPTFPSTPSFALSLSKGERRVFQRSVKDLGKLYAQTPMLIQHRLSQKPHLNKQALEAVNNKRLRLVTLIRVEPPSLV